MRTDRPALLNPGLRYLRRIGGLTQAMAELAGTTPAALATEKGFEAAAAAIREIPGLGRGQVRLGLERAENPLVAKHKAALERLRHEALRSGYDRAGLDALVVGSWDNAEARARLDALTRDASGVSRQANPTNRRRESAMGAVAGWMKGTRTPPSELEGRGASRRIDDMMARRHAQVGAGAKPLRARFRYALVGTPEERALAAAAVCDHVATYKGRLEAVVADAQAKDFAAAGRQSGVMRKGAKPAWSKDPVEDARLAPLVARHLAASWQTTRGGPDDGFTIALTRVCGGRAEGVALHGLFARADGTVEAKRLELAVPRGPGRDDVANDARLLDRDGGREDPEAFLQSPRPAPGLEEASYRQGARTPFAYKVERAVACVAALETARFRKEAPAEANLLHALCRTRLRRSGPELRRRPQEYDFGRNLRDYATLACAPDRARLLRAVETAPMLAGTVMSGCRALEQEGGAARMWGGTGPGPHVVKRHRREAAIVADLASGGSPYDAVARVVRGALELEGGAQRTKTTWGEEPVVPRRIAKAVAALATGDTRVLAGAGRGLGAMFAANPGMAAPGPREVAAIAADTVAFGREAGRRDGDLAKLLKACRKPGPGPNPRKGGPVARISDETADAVAFAHRAFQRLGLDRDGCGHALVRAMAPPGRNVNGLERVATRWHEETSKTTARRHRLVRDLVERHAGATRPGEDPRYPALKAFAVPAGHAGVEVRQLRDDDAMMAEGVAMDHCVGNYAPAAANGNLVVFHVEGPDGPSTAGYNVYQDDGALTFARNQHTGHKNSAAPAANVAALDAAMAALAADKGWMAEHVAAIGFAKARADEFQQAERNLPDAARREIAEFDFATLAPFLTARDVAMGRDAYVATIRAETAAARAERTAATDVGGDRVAEITRRRGDRPRQADVPARAAPARRDAMEAGR